MISPRQCAIGALALSCSPGQASARLAGQTMTDMDMELLQPGQTRLVVAPSPTVAAMLGGDLELFKRETSATPQLHTCGYLYGDSRQSFTCGGAYFCATYSQWKAFGCCTTTSPCQFPTACLPLSSSAAASSADLNYTLYCSDPERPYCAVAKYADSTFSGFTFQLCDTAATTVPIYYQAITTMTSSSSYYTLTSGTTTTTTPPPPPQNSSSTPVGAIVGGVVGGVAGLALIGLLSFFLLRRRRKNKLSSPAAQPFVAEQSQSSGYGGWPGQDQRSSVSNTLMSTPSQVPQSMYSPPYLGQQFAQAPAQPAGQYYSEVHEMPIESPHREAHEMGP